MSKSISADAQKPRSYTLGFPDGHDRTPNDPALLISSKSAIKIYEENTGSFYQSYDDVEAWFKERAPENKWTRITRLGHSFLLEVDFL